MSTEKITAPVPGEETLALLGRWGEAEPQAAEADFAAVFSGFNRKIVVLDDDPTGVQTVHDVAVYTDWSVETFRAGLLGEEKLFFVNRPVWIIVCEGGINFCKLRITLAEIIKWNECFSKVCMPAWAKNLHLWNNCAPDLFA